MELELELIKHILRSNPEVKWLNFAKDITISGKAKPLFKRQEVFTEKSAMRLEDQKFHIIEFRSREFAISEKFYRLYMHLQRNTPL